MNLKLAISLIAIVASTMAFGQTETDEELAQQYLDAGEYGKAKLYYQKLYESSSSRYHYKNLLTCYEKLDQVKDAEKLIKKQQRKNPGEVAYKIDLGIFYKHVSEKNKARQIFDRVINDLDDTFEEINNVAVTFQSYGELNLALKTYLKGRKLIRSYGFHFEIAAIYNQQKEYDKMIGEYLDVLEGGASYVQSVQNALQTNLDPDPENVKKAMLKTELLRRIQKNPNQPVYSEMIIWVFIQEKNFEGAFAQAKALDKRKKEDGFRLYNLGRLARSNKEYEVASDCYNYVVEKGEESRFYSNARMSIVKVLQEKIDNTGKYTKEDLTALDKSYETVVNDLGRSWRTLNFIKDWAHLKAFYLDDKEEAVKMLNNAIKMPGAVSQDKARCKMKLADVYLMYGAIWDASLLYSQVEKDFKNDQLGEEAKFKNAKVSYYAGDFSWAKAQLDVLKASTSKLISNDALSLSLLITDNTLNMGIDTNVAITTILPNADPSLDMSKAPLLMFARADLLLFRNKTAEALNALDSIKTVFPGHALTDEVLFKRHEVYKKKQEFEKASVELTEIVGSHFDDILADDALFNLATMTEYVFKEEEKAVELYKQLLLTFPGSLYADESRKSMRRIRSKEVQIKEWE